MSKRTKFKNKQKIKKIASVRMDKLFNLAKKEYKSDFDLANRYIKLARLTSMKYKVPLKSENKRLFCKHCKTLLIPARNSRVRVTGKTITYTCNECKKFTRIGYKQSKNNFGKTSKSKK